MKLGQPGLMTCVVKSVDEFEHGAKSRVLCIFSIFGSKNRWINKYGRDILQAICI